MFGIKIQNPGWEWVKDEEGKVLSFSTHKEASEKAAELGYSNYIIDVF